MVDLSALPADLRPTATWAFSLLQALIREKIAKRRPPRLTEPGLATWLAFRQRLTSTDLIALLLAIDEDLDDAGIPLTDRIGVLDSAWRVLPDAAREDATAANRLKAELQALVGLDGPSHDMVEAWRNRFPPPGTRGKQEKKKR